MDLIIIFEGYIILELLRLFFGINLISWILSDRLYIWPVNYIFNLGSHAFVIILLASIMALVLLYYFLYIGFFSELFSKFGIYHQLRNYDSPFSETIFTKIIKVYKLNLALSLLILIVIFFFVATIIKLNVTNNSEALVNICISFLVICPSILLSLRLLANPVKNSPIFLQIFIKSFARKYDNLQAIKKEKERILSLYSSMILTVLFTLVMLYTYQLVSDIEVISSLFVNLSKSAFSGDTLFKIIIIFFSFLICLFITTCIGEWFLKKYQVIDIDFGTIKYFKIKK